MNDKLDWCVESSDKTPKNRRKSFVCAFPLMLWLALNSCASSGTTQDLPEAKKENKEFVDDSKGAIQNVTGFLDETEFTDENNDTIKELHYADGSWSKEIINDMEQEYILYYPKSEKDPDSEKIKCYCHKGEGGQQIKFYNEEDGEIMYGYEFPGSYVTDSPDEFEQYDKKWRLIHFGNCEISYDDKKGTKTTIESLLGWSVFRIKIEESESWDVISDEIRGKTGNMITVGDFCDSLRKNGIPEAYRSSILPENN